MEIKWFRTIVLRCQMWYGIKNSLNKFRNTPLDVMIVSYGRSNGELVAAFKSDIWF
jgi:hypothetical protein